jgi:hypothetical protein
MIALLFNGRKRLIFFSFFVSISTLIFAQFTAGNIAVLQAGDGVSSFTNTGNQIIIREFSASGTPTFSVPISTSLNPLVISGSATSEGQLNLSPNGKYLVFSGYAQSLPNSINLSSSTAATINRGVGVLDAAGNYTRVALSNSFHSTSNIRSAASDGIGNYWSAGGSGGINYFGTVTASTNIQNSISNTRHVGIFGGNLFFSTGVGTTGVYQVGVGLPTSAQTSSLVINTAGTGSGAGGSCGFYFDPSQTICYVADERSIANGGGIQKWVNTSGAWSLAYTIATGSLSTTGARSVIADFSGVNPIIYATTAEANLNRLISIADVGFASTATTLATSNPNTIFRGIAFSPFCSAPQVSSITLNGLPCVNETLTLSANMISGTSLSYSWTGSGSFSSSSQNPTLTALGNGSYSVAITNGCGSASSNTFINIYPLPIISANSSTICTGGLATLTANGASSYTWSNLSNSSSISVSPVNSTTYSVIGESMQGCVNIASASVVINDSPSLSVNSASSCAGSVVILSATGVSSYTWANGVTTQTISVSPLVSSTYSLIGAASGCTFVLSATAAVTVYSVPLVSVNSASVCVGETVILNAVGADTFSWDNGLTGQSIITTPSINTNYTVTGFSSQTCSNAAIATVIVDACLGVNDITLDGVLNLYPNPANEKLHIAVNSFVQYAGLNIYNLIGKQIFTQTMYDKEIILDISNYAKGVYFVEIANNGKVNVWKFIKQ